MHDAPVAAHISRLVADLTSRQLEEEGDEDDEDYCDTIKQELESLPSEIVHSRSNSDFPRKRPVRIHRVSHGTKKRGREVSSDRRTALIHLAKQRLDGPLNKLDPSLSGADPFGAYELPADSTTDLGLHHWTYIFQNSRMGISPRQAWTKINLSDKTLLSVTTYCSASHFYFVRGIRAHPSCIPHKVNAIRNINNALMKPDPTPSDHTMVAVAVMTLLECLAGEPSAWVVHRKGLQLMVKSRGGMKNLGFGGAVQRTISWADTCCAILLRAKPSLEPILVPDIGESILPSFTMGDLEDRLLSLTASKDLSRQILYIWLRLRYLSEFVANVPDVTATTIDDCLFTDKVDFIERYVLQLLHSSSIGQSRAAGFITAFINASIIYIYNELRECPRLNNVSVCLSERIYSGLQMVDLSSVVKHCPELALWVVLLGRIGSVPLKDINKRWYEKVVIGLENHLDIDVPATVIGLDLFELAEGPKRNRRWNSRPSLRLSSESDRENKVERVKERKKPKPK